MPRRRISEADALAAVAADEVWMVVEGHIDVARARSAVRGAFAALSRVVPRNTARHLALHETWNRWTKFTPALVAYGRESDAT